MPPATTGDNTTSDALAAAAATAPRRRTYQVDTNQPPIDKGSLGVVYHGRETTTHEPVAVKLVTKAKVQPEMLRAVRHEADMLRQAGRHPHLQQLLDLGEDPSYLYLVTEVIPGGASLHTALQRGVRYDEAAARTLLKGVLEGIAHMHQRGVMHRNVKLEKVLLLESDRDAAAGEGTALPPPAPTHGVLVDFMYATPNHTEHSVCGTPYYLAPEVINAKARDGASRGYDKACDVWSFGVVAYMVLHDGAKPFDGRTMVDCVRLIRRNEPAWRTDLPPLARHFVEHLLVGDPSMRPSADDALAHPWISGDATMVPQILASSPLGLKATTISAPQRPASIAPAPGTDALAASRSTTASVLSLDDSLLSTGPDTKDAPTQRTADPPAQRRGTDAPPVRRLHVRTSALPRAPQQQHVVPPSRRVTVSPNALPHGVVPLPPPSPPPVVCPTPRNERRVLEAVMALAPMPQWCSTPALPGFRALPVVNV